MADVLVDDAADRARRLAATGVGLLLVVLVGATILRSTLPPPPVVVDLAGVSGSALDGESFVRLHLLLRSDGVSDLGTAQLTVAGGTHGGQHLTAVDEDGVLRLQVDVTPVCTDVAAGRTAGRLDLELLDERGRSHEVRLAVPAEGPLDRLLRYRCREPSPGS